MARPKKTAAEYASGFKHIRDEDVDPKWPNHTGRKIYKSGRFVVVLENMGGITAKQRLELLDGKKSVAILFNVMEVRSLKKWLTEQLTSYLGA